MLTNQNVKEIALIVIMMNIQNVGIKMRVGVNYE